MVQGQPRRRELRHTHHVARYCRPRDIGDSGRLLATAFRLRPGEEYLSTNWLELFHDSDRYSQISGVRRALTDKGFRVSRNSCFAVLNAGDAVMICKNNFNLDIQFISLGEIHDPSHTGIYGCTTHGTAVALAAIVNPSEVYPAVT